MALVDPDIELDFERAYAASRSCFFTEGFSAGLFSGAVFVLAGPLDAVTWSIVIIIFAGFGQYRLTRNAALHQIGMLNHVLFFGGQVLGSLIGIGLLYFAHSASAYLSQT